MTFFFHVSQNLFSSPDNGVLLLKIEKHSILWKWQEFPWGIILLGTWPAWHWIHAWTTKRPDEASLDDLFLFWERSYFTFRNNNRPSDWQKETEGPNWKWDQLAAWHLLKPSSKGGQIGLTDKKLRQAVLHIRRGLEDVYFLTMVGINGITNAKSSVSLVNHNRAGDIVQR